MSLSSLSTYLLVVLSVLFLKTSTGISYEDFSTLPTSFSYIEYPENFGNLRILVPFLQGQNSFTRWGNFHSKMESSLARMYISRCPESYDRIDPKTGKCHTIGTPGPCGQHMIFTGNEYLNPLDKASGRCECDSDSYDRPLVLVGDQCHFIYTQAICPSRYWLVVSKNLGTICKPNPCEIKRPETTTSIASSVLFKGECVKLRSTSKHCGNKDEVILFPKGALEPICGPSHKTSRRVYKRQISKVNALKCQAGTIWSRITHKCRPVLQSRATRE